MHPIWRFRRLAFLEHAWKWNSRVAEKREREPMKIVIMTDDRHSMGTISGVTREDLDDPVRLPILLDEIHNIMDRYEAQHRLPPSYTGATQQLEPSPTKSLRRRLWERLIWRFK
jgi:hypothetical protein